MYIFSGTDSNFITQIFTLTLAYLHYGPIKSFSDYQEQVKACADFKQELEDYERNQLNDPVNGPMANIILQRGKVCGHQERKIKLILSEGV
jgi:ubiquitin conjugation factor E4 B